MKYLLFSSFALLIVASCQPGVRSNNQRLHTETVFENQEHEDFFLNLADLCGQSFQGKQIYRSHHGESWADRKMIMHVAVCEHDRIEIPFHVDQDMSRTWIFKAEEGRLRFRHQHLHEDGTHEDDSMYGGYADDKGNAWIQYFPADEFTAGVIEDGAGNLWTVTINKEMNTFSYRLDRDGEKRFEILFDLNKPVEK